MPPSPAPASTGQVASDAPVGRDRQTRDRPREAGAALPLGIVWLAAVAAGNSARLHVMWDAVGAHVQLWARNPASAVRLFGLEFCTAMACAAVASDATPISPEQGVAADALAPVPEEGTSSAETLASRARRSSSAHSRCCLSTAPVVPQASLLAPLVDYWKSPYHDTRSATMRSIHRILEEVGHLLACGDAGGWYTVLAILAAAPHAVTVHLSTHAEPGAEPKQPAWAVHTATACRASSTDGSQPDDASARDLATLARDLATDRHAAAIVVGDKVDDGGTRMPSATAAGVALVQSAFRCLRLVVDELCELVLTQETERRNEFRPVAAAMLVGTVGTFIEQTADVNVSFTAITALWTVADAVAKQISSGDATQAVRVWSVLLHQLHTHCLDARPEVCCSVSPQPSVFA